MEKRGKRKDLKTMTTTSDLRERPKPNNSTDYKGATWRVGEAKSSDLTSGYSPYLAAGLIRVIGRLPGMDV